MFDENIKKKRIMNEQLRLQKSKLGFAQIYANNDNPMEFHFLLKGHDDSEYKGGYYIGKIKIDKDYPIKAGDFMMLTPSGRFDINKNICLSNSAYHQNEHTPLWSIENMVVGMASIFHEEDHDEKGKPKHSISHRYDSKELRKLYASDSISYNMKHYSSLFTKFNQLIDEFGFPKTEQHKKEPEKQEPLKELETKEPEKQEPLKELETKEPEKQELLKELETKEPLKELTKESLKELTKEQLKTSVKIKKNKTDLTKNSFLEEQSKKLNEYLENIKNMSFDEFDIKFYQNIVDLLSPINLSEI